MTIVAATAAVGNWLDTETPLTAAVLAVVKSQGYVGIMRYVPLPGLSGRGDITADELAEICAAGLDALLIQHPRYAGWLPEEHSGREDALVAIARSFGAGYPLDCHLGNDAEGMGNTSTTLGALAFLNDWSSCVRQAKLRALQYVGYDVPLSGLDWYAHLPHVDCYWSDATPHHVETRSFAIRQSSQIIIAGVKFDRNVVAPDLLGGLPRVARWQPDLAVA